jgi:hypothetical protein
MDSELRAHALPVIKEVDPPPNEKGRHNPVTTPHANATLTNLKFIGKPLYTWMIFSEAIPETAYISKQPRNNTQKARSFLDLTNIQRQDSQ